MLATYGPRFGLDRETALRVGASFGGGMGRMGETCGAVTGAFMVIGLQHGRTTADKSRGRDKAYDLVERFVQEFKARNNTIVCRDLLGCDISTPGGMEEVKKKNLFTTVCPRFVRDAAEILELIIEP